MSLQERLRFFSAFVGRPRTVGAVLPSSRSLACKMVDWIDFNDTHAVVEYGPGTGVFTEAILSRLHPGSRMLGIELNPGFAETLRQRFPDVPIYQDNVKNVGAICSQEGIDQVDVVISGLPWAAFSTEDQLDLLQATRAVLRPGGQFVTFAYLQGLLLPAGRRFKAELRRAFSSVETSEIAWMNFPPAFVYRCRH